MQKLPGPIDKALRQLVLGALLFPFRSRTTPTYKTKQAIINSYIIEAVMRANQLCSLEFIDTGNGFCLKDLPAKSNGRHLTEDERANKKVKQQFDNICVVGPKEDLGRVNYDLTRNNEFIQPSQNYKKTNFLLMDFSSLGAFKGEERKGFMDQRHRKKTTLPQLNSLCKNVNPDDSSKSVPKAKMLDLMIGILKDNHSKEYYSRGKNSQSQKSQTPLSRAQLWYQSQFKTEPSSSKSLKLETKDKSKKRLRGPKVIQNQILKHSTNLNIIRKKMFSQNRGRQPRRQRFDIQSSQNDRLHSCGDIKHDDKEVELLTFYPKQLVQSSEEVNQFLQDGVEESRQLREDLFDFSLG